MEIIDFRPTPERILAGASSRPGHGHALARLAGRLANFVAAGRAARRQAPPPGVLVVSVGNLRVGGTGKTPVVGALAEELASRGIPGAIITRGYGAVAKGPLVVRPGDLHAADESRLLARQIGHVDWTVIQARRRDRGLAFALNVSPSPRVVLLEDGYQTARLGRHLDVLILDAWDHCDAEIQPVAGPVLPFGPYRETGAAAARADVWLLEAADLADGLTAGLGRGIAVAGFVRRLQLADIEGATPPATAAVHGLVAGLARPERFEAGCTDLLPQPPALAVRCRDHCRYDPALVRRILAAGARCGVTAWVTTEKDWIKLRDVWPHSVSIQVIELTVTWTGRKTLPDLVEERLKILSAGGRDA